MGNTNQPNSPDDLNAADLALVERIGVLERQMAERRAGGDSVEEGDSSQQARMSAELERHRDQLRDYEKALVERIADVDDDRRATASRLQRAWQTQREEIDDRLRRYAGLVAGLMLVFALVVAVALVLVYRQATTAQPQIVEEIGQMRQDLDRVGKNSLSGERVHGELERLNAEFEQIATSLRQSSQSDDQADRATLAAERAAREEGEARIAEEIRRLNAAADAREKAESRIAEEIRRLDAERARLADELAGLRADLEAPESARTEAAASGAPGQPLPEPRSGISAAGMAPAPGEPVTGAGLAGGGEDAPLVPAGTTAESGAQAGEVARGADEDAHALGSEETIVAGEEAYALQLIGFFSRDSLAGFAAREGLPARVFYIRQTYRGRPWYAMVHSLHTGYASAVEALSGLPEDLVTLNPWIRPVPAGTELRVLESGAGPAGAGD